MLFSIAMAVPLIIIALICWVIAGRIDIKRKIKGWSGERTTVVEAETSRRQITALRIASVVCVVVAVLGALALNLLLAYKAYGAH